MSSDVTRDFDGIELAPGTETNIAVDRTFVSKMSSPYSDCVSNQNPLESPNEFIEQTVSYFQNYTQQKCMDLCYQNFLKKTRNCYDKNRLHTNTSLPVKIYN